MLLISFYRINIGSSVRDRCGECEWWEHPYKGRLSLDAFFKIRSFLQAYALWSCCTKTKCDACTVRRKAEVLASLPAQGQWKGCPWVMLQVKWTYGYTTTEEDWASKRAEARGIRQICVLRGALSHLTQSHYPLPSACYIRGSLPN